MSTGKPGGEDAGNASREGALRKDLRPWHVLAIVVGAVLGTGIYIRPASVAQQLASPTAIMLVWLAGGLLSLWGALTYAQLAIRIPGTGGEYRFLRQTLGELPAFLYGWMRLIVSPAVIASLAVAFAVFLGDLMPLASRSRQAIAVSVILALSWINSSGVGRAGRFQLLVTIGKVVGLGLLILAITAIGQGGSADQSAAPAVAGTSGFLATGAALLAAMAAYNGWANAALLGGEIQDAQRVLPWALVGGVLVVTGLYVAANLGFLHALPLQDIITSNSAAYPNAASVASKAVQRALSSRAAAALPIIFALSTLGAAHCNVLAIPRVLISMAQDGLLPHALAQVSRKTGAPSRAIWTIGGLAAAFAAVGNYDRLSNMTTFSFLVFFALTTAGFLWSLWRQPASLRRPTPWQTTLIAGLFLVGTSTLVVNLLLQGSFEVLSAVVLIGLGIPVFGLITVWRRR
jgi:APA family basic amino acid/polyamine antiporter